MPRRFLFVLALFLSCLSAASFAQSDTGDFSVVLLPDTQFYSQDFPQTFTAQTQWIVNNAAGKNIRMVVGEGDIVNHDSDATQWANAVAAANILDGKVPYTFAIGNHDYDNFKPSARGTTEFNTYFGPSRYAGYSWYGGNWNGGNENFYTFFTAGGANYMVLALEFFPRDAVLDWANNVVSANPDKKVIVVTHSFEGTDGFRVDTCDSNDVSPQNGNFPQSVWNKLIKSHSNIFLVVSGHLLGSGTAHRTDLGDNGNLVHQIFTNFQGWTNGGNGYLRVLTFHVASNTIDVTTYSPTLNSSLTTSAFQFTLPLTYSPAVGSTGGFSGKVRNTACTRLPGATVSAAGFSATTDSNGIYKLPGLPAPNSYGVQALASGYNSNTITASAPQALNAELNFYLTAATNPGPCTLSTVDPSVTICNPLPNSTVTSPVQVVAGTTSSSKVSFMQIYVDGVQKGTFYSTSISQSVAMTSGSHRITVQAKNAAGVTFKSSVTATVGSSTPTPTSVTITSPANNATVNSPVTVSANATPATGASITSMVVLLDGTQVFTTASSSVNTSVTANPGTHTLTVQATDSTSTVTSKSVSFTVPSPTATSVTITSPANNATVNSPVTVTASATPATGATIASMAVLLDGAQVFTTASSTVNTSVTANPGTHTLTVQATDSTSTVATKSVSFTVPSATTVTTVTISSPLDQSTVASPFTVNAKATPGTGLTISYINLYLDGVKKVGVSGATLNTTVSTTSGTHRLTVQTKDSSGAIINKSINITVK
jgi:hypothetical protein